MSSGVVRHGQWQTGTYHWKIRRIFQVGENKPLLIHTVGNSYFFKCPIRNRLLFPFHLSYISRTSFRDQYRK
jgi:hypothetical protein